MPSEKDYSIGGLVKRQPPSYNDDDQGFNDGDLTDHRFISKEPINPEISPTKHPARLAEGYSRKLYATPATESPDIQRLRASIMTPKGTQVNRNQLPSFDETELKERLHRK